MKPFEGTEHRVSAIDGTGLYYTVEGEGPIDFLLCDGLGCDGFIWRYLRPTLLKQGRIIHLHMRGHGQSDPPRSRGPLHIARFADDWRPVLDAVGSRKAIALGHSMGVQVALELWHRHPDPIAGLVLICGSYQNPAATFHEGGGLQRLLPMLERATRVGGRTLRRVWRRLVALPLAYHVAKVGEIHPDLMRREDFDAYIDHLSRMDPHVFMRALKGAARHSADGYLDRIDVPVLIVGGTEDTFTPGRLSDEMARRMPDAKLVMVEEGTHTVPLEHASLVNLEVAHFAERVLTGRPARDPAPPPVADAV